MIWRVIFGLAAAFNGLVGLAMLLAPERGAEAFGQEPPFLLPRLAGVLIFMFGVGYAMVAADPVRNRAIAWMGLFGKLGAVGLAAAYYRVGLVPAQVFHLSLGDLLFVALFGLYLWRAPR